MGQKEDRWDIKRRGIVTDLNHYLCNQQIIQENISVQEVERMSSLVLYKCTCA